MLLIHEGTPDSDRRRGTKETDMTTEEHVYPNTVAELQARITARAYELWQEMGSPDDQDRTIWMQAEKEILALKPETGG